MVSLLFSNVYTVKVPSHGVTATATTSLQVFTLGGRRQRQHPNTYICKFAVAVAAAKWVPNPFHDDIVAVAVAAPLPNVNTPYLFALNPFIGNDVVAVAVAQCERTLKGINKPSVKQRVKQQGPIEMHCDAPKWVPDPFPRSKWERQNFKTAAQLKHF